MKEHRYFIYILASTSGTLYIGMTNDLERRLWEHHNGVIEGFSKKYDCKKLVYFEQTPDVYSAIAREKEMKSWNRKRKERLIRGFNPTWRDLYPDDGTQRDCHPEPRPPARR